MGNTTFQGLTESAHSVVVLVNYFKCKRDLTGANREVLLGDLRKAVEAAGLGVLDGDIQPFGRNMQERNENGATLNLILEDSGVSFDCYPEAGTVQMNLHYCNITNNNDGKVGACIENIRVVLEAEYAFQYEPIVMPIWAVPVM